MNPGATKWVQSNIYPTGCLGSKCAMWNDAGNCTGNCADNHEHDRWPDPAAKEKG